MISGHQLATQTLLALGADPNLKNREMETTLHKAVELGHRKIAKDLLWAKADPDA